MNLAIRGIEGNIEQGDTFHNDRHPDSRADYVLANPPFNVSDWGGELLVDDYRWRYGTPPRGNANFAWVQHMVCHLSPRGVAGIVLANGSMSSNQSNEGEIGRNLIESDLVDCMIALPGLLFYSTQIPACLWFLARNRRGEILFIDARKMGTMVDRTHHESSGDDIQRITDTYRAWRSKEDLAPPSFASLDSRVRWNDVGVGGNDGGFEDVSGFCKSSSLEEVRMHGHVLTPGRYV